MIKQQFSFPILLMGLFFAPNLKAERIKVPESELAKEYVLPKFDTKDVVKTRNVVTAQKFEFGAYYGMNITEPIYNQSKFGINAGYHLSEDSAIVLNFAKWADGLNSFYTDNLQSTTAHNPTLDFSRVPKRNYSLYGHYELKTFYGKISITKSGVMNLTTYPIFGLGFTAYEHKNYYGFDAGIGQKFYFSKSFALRADFKFQFSEAPNPFAGTNVQSNFPKPEASQFQDKWGYNFILDIGLSFLL